jgi:hypothetical protein
MRTSWPDLGALVSRVERLAATDEDLHLISDDAAGSPEEEGLLPIVPEDGERSVASFARFDASVRSS